RAIELVEALVHQFQLIAMLIEHPRADDGDEVTSKCDNDGEDCGIMQNGRDRQDVHERYLRAAVYPRHRGKHVIQIRMLQAISPCSSLAEEKAVLRTRTRRRSRRPWARAFL